MSYLVPWRVVLILIVCCMGSINVMAVGEALSAPNELVAGYKPNGSDICVYDVVNFEWMGLHSGVRSGQITGLF
jgi:coenzyme F420-reducing hydrogenase delta subunit